MLHTPRVTHNRASVEKVVIAEFVLENCVLRYLYFIRKRMCGPQAVCEGGNVNDLYTVAVNRIGATVHHVLRKVSAA